MSKNPKVILITGASSGIGEATPATSPPRVTTCSSAPAGPSGWKS